MCTGRSDLAMFRSVLGFLGSRAVTGPAVRGATALQRAAELGRAAMVPLLLQQGADPNLAAEGKAR